MKSRTHCQIFSRLLGISSSKLPSTWLSSGWLSSSASAKVGILMTQLTMISRRVAFLRQGCLCFWNSPHHRLRRICLQDSSSLSAGASFGLIAKTWTLLLSLRLCVFSLCFFYQVSFQSWIYNQDWSLFIYNKNVNTVRPDFHLDFDEDDLKMPMITSLMTGMIKVEG